MSELSGWRWGGHTAELKMSQNKAKEEKPSWENDFVGTEKKKF